MPGTLWVVSETGVDGHLARITTEVATLARGLGEAAGREVVGVVVAAQSAGLAGAADELAAYLPRVLSVEAPAAETSPAAAIVATAVAGLIAGDPTACVFLGASPDGRDTAGFLSVMLGMGVLANATGVTWDGGPVVEKGVFGGRLITTSSFTDGHGIVTIRLGSVVAEPAPTPGRVEAAPLPDPGTVAGAGQALPGASPVTILDRVTEAGGAVQIEEAKVIVAGGRGVGSPEGFRVVEELAAELGGAVAASRAAVDAGWIPYARQVGQTGKIVKPVLYVALGISGAVQHKVGMQGAQNIVAVNTDSDAPIAEFADVFVVGNLFEFVPALIAELRSRRA
jgi:electron transfer flavoprotein alpha subunit